MKKRNRDRKIAIHISWEALIKLGGIGAVLENLISLPAYRQAFSRTILLSPNFPDAFGLRVDPVAILGGEGEILYGAARDTSCHDLCEKLEPLERHYNISILYGRRTFSEDNGLSQKADVIIVDFGAAFQDIRYGMQRLRPFMHRLARHLEIGADEAIGGEYVDYDYYYGLLLAEPAFDILATILAGLDCEQILVAHSLLGLPTLYKAILDGRKQFRTVFFAEDCASARYWIETATGADIQFYNILRKSREQKKYMEDIYGNMSFHDQHRLLVRAHHCDVVIATSDNVAEELRFLSREFDKKQINVCPHGVPWEPITLEQKANFRKVLQTYSEELVGFEPQVLMCHVARPIRCKGLWRDLAVCDEMDRILSEKCMNGILYIISSNHGSRLSQEIQQMEHAYLWPRYHRLGSPDLLGDEIDLYQMVEDFNDRHANVKAVLVNSFNWPSGEGSAPGMSRMQLRMAVDIEFGMSTYEAFGISHLESLCFGSICVVSRICGVVEAIEEVANQADLGNIIIADYVAPGEGLSVERLLKLTNEERLEIEKAVAFEVAMEIGQRLPVTDAQRLVLIESGQNLARRMRWRELVGNRLVSVLCGVAKEEEDSCEV